MPYFHDCTTKQDAKQKHRKLVKELHPDMGGDAIKFAEMQNEFDNFSEHENYSNEYQKASEEAVRSAYEEYFNRYNHFASSNPYNRSFYNQQNEHHIDIPFDHPIHEKLRLLKEENLIHKKQITELKESDRKYRAEIKKLNDYHSNCLSNIKKLDLEIINLNDKNINLEYELQCMKSYVDLIENQTLFQCIKTWLGL